MPNPWKNIPAADYEAHMSSASVGQLQALNKIFRLQYQRYNPKVMAVFGICTGNGLEHINPIVTSDVFGVDVNSEYLNICKMRHGTKGFALHVIEADINDTTVQFPACDLIIADLFLEYVELEKFIEQVRIISHGSTVLSVAIQANNEQLFVSETDYQSLQSLSAFHHDIEPNEFASTMKQQKFKLVFSERYSLPSGKELVRFDFSV